MRDETFAEEGRNAAARAIEKLIGNDEIERPKLFFERSNSAQRKNALYAERLHAIDVRAEIQSEGESRCPRAVARQERDCMTFQFANDVVIRRRAERCVDRDFFLRVEAWHGVQTAAADDADSGHFNLLASILDKFP